MHVVVLVYLLYALFIVSDTRFERLDLVHEQFLEIILNFLDFPLKLAIFLFELLHHDVLATDRSLQLRLCSLQVVHL